MILSTLISIVGIYLASLVLKDNFEYEGKLVYRNHLVIVTIIGLINGFLIGMITNYYTSYDYAPV